ERRRDPDSRRQGRDRPAGRAPAPGGRLPRLARGGRRPHPRRRHRRPAGGRRADHHRAGLQHAQPDLPVERQHLQPAAGIGAGRHHRPGHRLRAAGRRDRPLGRLGERPVGRAAGRPLGRPRRARRARHRHLPAGGRGHRHPLLAALQPARSAELRHHARRPAGLRRRAALAAGRQGRGQPPVRLAAGAVHPDPVRARPAVLPVRRRRRGGSLRHRNGPRARAAQGRPVGAVGDRPGPAQPGAVRPAGSGRRLPQPDPRRRLDVRLLRGSGARHALRPHAHQVRPLDVRGRGQSGGGATRGHQRQARLHVRLRPLLDLRGARRAPRRRAPGRRQPGQRRSRREPQRHRGGGDRGHQPVRRPRLGLRRPARHPRDPGDLQRADAAEPRLVLSLHDHRRRAAAGGQPRLRRPPLARIPRARV
ncbi:MAG: Various polyols ABC transporter, permease protein, partial [uncultured Solirubrobacteraceae bacterium]